VQRDLIFSQAVSSISVREIDLSSHGHVEVTGIFNVIKQK